LGNAGAEFIFPLNNLFGQMFLLTCIAKQGLLALLYHKCYLIYIRSRVADQYPAD
jgi:hypothetical protein